jgi:hypothetical protein
MAIITDVLRIGCTTTLLIRLAICDFEEVLPYQSWEPFRSRFRPCYPKRALLDIFEKLYITFLITTTRNDAIKPVSMPEIDRCKDARSALLYAAEAGHLIEVISLLGLYPTEIDSHDNHGRTALFYTAAAGHVKAVKLLLSRKT